MKNEKFRPSAVPLVTVDPYFSIWSTKDRLYDDVTRHWTGRSNSMVGMVLVDGKPYIFMGLYTGTQRDYDNFVPALPQVDCRITPTSSVYTFENEALVLTVTFTSPLLLDDIELMSRPVSYVRYKAVFKDGGDHAFKLYFDISSEACTELLSQKVEIGRTDRSIYCGNAEQKILHKSGDSIRIDWGYLHLCHEGAFLSNKSNRRSFARGRDQKPLDESKIYDSDALITLATVSDKTEDMILLGYDDIHSINYFGDLLDGCYKRRWETFDRALEAAMTDADEVFARCDKFDSTLAGMVSEFGEDYANVAILSYRQAIAAHKAVYTKDGSLLFLSKECHSNGCIGTLDVTYPSIPLFLIFNPELVKGMLRPIVRQAEEDWWIWDFAPHDVGQYPLATGQVYGERDKEDFITKQMPVEECGNFLLSVAAVCRAEGSKAYADENAAIMKKWADYLVEYGYKPENQLCTDDFAGHLAYNCNLSLKAITALGAYGQLMGYEKYTAAAVDMANRFMSDAANSEATRLTFDREDSWSLKYNAVWDRLLGLRLFPDDFYRREIALYKKKCARYGAPLDCRADYTKIDWLAWTTVLIDDAEYRDMTYKATARMVSETEQRVPVTDWYDAVTAKQYMFQNRSVLGGFFINLLPGRRGFEK